MYYYFANKCSRSDYCDDDDDSYSYYYDNDCSITFAMHLYDNFINKNHIVIMRFYCYTHRIGK